MAWRKYWKKGDDIFQNSKAYGSAESVQTKIDDTYQLNPESKVDYWNDIKPINEQDFKPLVKASLLFSLSKNVKSEERSNTLNSKPATKIVRFEDLSDDSSSSSSGSCSSGSCSSCRREKREKESKFIKDNTLLNPILKSDRASALSKESELNHKIDSDDFTDAASSSETDTDVSEETKFMEYRLRRAAFSYPMEPARKSARIDELAKVNSFHHTLDESEDSETEADDSGKDVPFKSESFGVQTPYSRMSLKLKINVFRVYLEMMAADLKKMKFNQKINFKREDLIQLGKKTAEYLFMDYFKINSNWIGILRNEYGITNKDFPGMEETEKE